LIVGISSARNEDRDGAHASEQEIAHRYPPCDSTAGERRDGTCCAASRHPFDGKSFRQRVTAQRSAGLGTYASPKLTRIRQNSRCADVVEAGNRKKPIPAIDRPQESFSAFVEHLDVTPPASNPKQKGRFHLGTTPRASPFVLLRAHARWRCGAKVSA